MPRADRLIRLVTFVARLGTGVGFAVLIASVLIQVVGRVVDFSPVWTEELTRFALLFTIAFGAGLALRTGDLVNVDIVSEALPGRAPWVLRLVAALCTAALGVRMDLIHLTVFLMLAFLALFALLRVFGMLTGAEDGVPVKPEEEA